MAVTSLQDVLPDQTYNEDGCPVLPKLQLHEVQQGQDALLKWNMKDRRGNTIDLSDMCPDESAVSDDEGEDFDAVSDPGCGIELRVREMTGNNPSTHSVHTVQAEVTDPAVGEVKAASLPDIIRTVPGIYWEEWAIIGPEGNMLFSNQVMLWVNEGLFGLTSDLAKRGLGPPSISEIRLSIRDNSGEDNLLLDDVEFDAAEIAQAVSRPLGLFNEVPPPLRPPRDTTNFPFREHWLIGIQAHLLLTAAHNFRRNHLPYNAGGIAVDDKNNEAEYMRAGKDLLEQYRNWVQQKKVEINTALFTGSVGSLYGGLFQ